MLASWRKFAVFPMRRSYVYSFPIVLFGSMILWARLWPSLHFFTVRMTAFRMHPPSAYPCCV